MVNNGCDITLLHFQILRTHAQECTKELVRATSVKSSIDLPYFIERALPIKLDPKMHSHTQMTAKIGVKLFILSLQYVCKIATCEIWRLIGKEGKYELKMGP